MTAYNSHFSAKATAQSQPIPGSNQVANSAGGFSFAVDDWTRLERFLILGAEGGSYYASEQALTIENAQAVLRCVKADGLRTVNTIVDVSVNGRAHKNDPALFALAIAAGLGDVSTKTAALSALGQVARTGTHLFTFLNYVQSFRGWGRGLRSAVANWYLSKDPNQLAYQMAKYRQRNGWTHRDVLRKSHAQATTDAHNALFGWVTQDTHGDDLPELINAFEQLQSATDASQVINLVTNNKGLSWEMIPTQFLGDKSVWEALLPDLPMTALIRNLGRLSSNGLLVPGSAAVGTVVSKLGNAEAISKARVHPISVLSALLTYQKGKGARGNLIWTPVGQVVDALDGAFYTSFGNVESTGKRRMLALDASASMTWSEISGVPGLRPREGSAAMALVTAAVESNYVITAFSHAGGWSNYKSGDQGIEVLNISPKQRLDDVVKTVGGLYAGGTDCSLPMQYALKNKMEIDSFEVYTDSETWHGQIHPTQALAEYRNKTGIPAKLVVVGMVANNFSIADPNDAGMLDVVGFDTSAPNVISSFIS